MADETKTDPQAPAAEAAAVPKKSKKGLLLGGGLVALVATGYALSLVAAPKLPVDMSFEGPFVVDLCADELQVNLARNGGRSFLVMTLKAEVYSYSQAYPAARLTDPLYVAKLKDVLIGISTQKSKEEIETPIGKEIFKEELRESVDSVLFPVHVGSEKSPYESHVKSGLRPGESCRRSTYREGFMSGVLEVDALRKTIALDGGAPIAFHGDETDLQVSDAGGRFVYVDVTELHADFKGRVHVGTFGRVKGILFNSIIFQ